MSLQINQIVWKNSILSLISVWKPECNELGGLTSQINVSGRAITNLLCGTSSSNEDHSNTYPGLQYRLAWSKFFVSTQNTYTSLNTPRLYSHLLTPTQSVKNKGNIIIFINITTKYWTKLQVASVSTKGKGIYCCGLSIEFSLDFLLPFQFTSPNNLVFQSSDFINLFWQSFQETIRLLLEMKVF